MSLCLLVIGDGRDDVHERADASLKKHLPPIEHKVVVDDREHELGFAGAIADGWQKVLAKGADYVFHFEADFVFNAPVPIDRIMRVLHRHPYLAQVCLKRQPWNEAERAAGGIVELNRDDYRQRFAAGDVWTEHRICFSTNPCIYPAALCRMGWPQEPHSEGEFSRRLREDPDVRFAFWGAKFAPPLVEHIGTERTGLGY